MNKLHIIIPLGGIGSRFNNYSHLPKALIPVLNKPILFWVIDSLVKYHQNICFIIPYNKIYKEFNLETLLIKEYPMVDFHFICLETQTRGAAESLYIALQDFHQKIGRDDIPFMAIDGDNFYKEDILSEWDFQNKLIVFEDKQDKPLFSYIQTENQYIKKIVEKEKISNLANCGAYGFSSSKDFCNNCQKLINDDIRAKNEFYTSGVISYMINKQNKFTYYVISTDNYISLGTPEQIVQFYNSLSEKSATSSSNLPSDSEINNCKNFL